MQDDGPTLPSLRRLHRYVTGASGEYRSPSGSTTWPKDSRHNQPSSSSHNRTPLVLGASLCANVVLLIVLLSVLVLTHGGFSPSKVPVGFSSPVSRVSTVSPRASIDTPTATPAGWLEVTSTNLQLACNNGQQTQFVVLKNTGSEPVPWQVLFSLPANQVGVNVTPNQGTLPAGSTTAIQIQNQTRAHGPQGVAVQQGTIEFNPEVVGAGPPPTITYTTVGC